MEATFFLKVELIEVELFSDIESIKARLGHIV